MTVLIAIIAFALGTIIGILLTRGGKLKEQAHVQALRTQLDEAHLREEAQRSNVHQLVDNLKAEAQQRLKEEKDEWRQATDIRLAEQEKHHEQTFSEQERRHQEAIAAQQQRFDEMLAKVSAQVKSATDDMLRQRQQEFAKSSSENLGQIVSPLRDTIDRMKQAVSDSTLRQTELSGQLKANIEQMIRQSEAARKSAEELARAFKHGSKVQGDWGERVLGELLESQGLTEGVHFDVQTYLRDAQGNIITDDRGAMMRPDVILHLDQRREVVIDSKVSMTAFMDYVNAEDEADRSRLLKAHVDSLQKHVKELAAKDYSAYIRPPKVRMDYVIMFVPHSGALWAALSAQSDLWRKAMERGVFIADEQTLFAALRIVSLTWTQIAQAQNHEKVYALAEEMLDRVGQFMKKYQAVGKALEQAQKAYDDGDRKLQPTGKSILQTCAKLTRLGARQSDKNPLPQLQDLEPVIESVDDEYETDDNDTGTDSQR